MMLPESGTRKGIGRSRSQRRKSEVMCSRSRSGRPYLLRQAPCPKASHFPLALYPIAWEEGIQRKKSKVVCGRSRSGRPYPLRQAPSPQDFPFPLALYPIARQEGIQREKVWSCPVRQDRAVHRRSEACMAGAQLASLPWLTVDSFGLPPPFPPPFSFGCS